MDVKLHEAQGVRLAVEGCGHGTLNAIYASVKEACNQIGWPDVDLLIIGGDFQAVRNAFDLNCVSMPAKYRQMCDFHEYYSGKRQAPYLTMFVGGNHEASNYLFELYYGGWVAPHIYYMGAANVLRFGPLRIAGMSGIWKGYNYRKPHYERLPYNESDMKSIYHIRELDVRKLLQIRSQVDIGISHDWPRGVEKCGNWKQLFRFKPHLADDSNSGQLGSHAAQDVMDWLRPRYWFSAHLHAKFAATVQHEDRNTQSSDMYGGAATRQVPLIQKNAPESTAVIDGVPGKNEDEVDLDADLDMDEAETTTADAQDETSALSKDTRETDTGAVVNVAEDQILSAAAPTISAEEARAALPEAFRRTSDHESIRERPPDITNTQTQFLALDKCLPEKHFLQLLSITDEGQGGVVRPFRISYDPEWLAITRCFAINEPLILGNPSASVPRPKSQKEYLAAVDEAKQWIEQKIGRQNLVVPKDFEIVAPVYDDGDWNEPTYRRSPEYPNPQTAQFCAMLQIPNPFAISDDERDQRQKAGPAWDPHGEAFSGSGRGGGRGRGNFQGKHRGRDGRGRGWRGGRG